MNEVFMNIYYNLPSLRRILSKALSIASETLALNSGTELPSSWSASDSDAARRRLNPEFAPLVIGYVGLRFQTGGAVEAVAKA
jgi:hypothetical protein